ncbi:GNAT family N-acetyltransferase [Nocardiopsis alba]|uniref:GNAT family N-acetyltransferase n=1 Tax=Nocardiopsis alba TaxID=53437 RepID=UPI0035D681D4
MRKETLNRFIRIRHFQESDIPLRVELMNDDRYMANVRDTALSTGANELERWHLDVLNEHPRSTMLFTATTNKGQVLGFTWVYDIDWTGPSGQLSIAMFPRYRTGWGSLAIQATSALLFDEFGFQRITTQIFTHNTMMHSDEWTSERTDLLLPYFAFVSGRFCHSRIWTQSQEEYRLFSDT